MTRRAPSAMLAVAAVLLAACQTGPMPLPAGATQIGARELRLFFTNATITGSSEATGGGYEAYYAPDGTVRMRSNGFVRDSGRYQVTDDGMLCVQFMLARAGQQMCSAFYQDGQRLFRVESDGSVQPFEDQRRPGNPENL